MSEKTIELGVVTVPTAEELEAEPTDINFGRPKATFRKLSEEEVLDYLSL